MNSVETEGRTVDDAVAAALTQLQVERDRVEIEILTQASKGFLGIGGKKARVRVTLRAPAARQAEAPSPVGRRRDTPRMPEPRAPELRTPAQRAPERMPESRAPEPRTPAPRASERIPEPRMPAPRAPEPRLPVSRIPEASLPTESFEATPFHPEQGEKASEILQEILRHMEAEASVALDQRSNEVLLTLTGKDSAALIGRNGQILDALEYVLNRIVTRSEESDAHLTLDAEGYRERRRKNLENLALRLGERAKRRKRPVALSLLSPRDRRVIHLTLEGDPLISTRSMGRGYFRRLYIVPEEGPRRERSRGGPRMLSGDA